MVRFSCFQGHLHCHKSKKTVQPSVEAMHKTTHDLSRSQLSRDPPLTTKLNELSVNTERNIQANNSADSPVERNWKLNNIERGQLKKSQSLGSMIYLQGRAFGDSDNEEGMDLRFSCDSSPDHSFVAVDYQMNRGRPPANNETIFSIGDPLPSENGGHEENSNVLCMDESAKQTPHTSHVIVKSRSMPNFGISSPTSGGYSCYKDLALQSRSSEDLCLLNVRRREMSVHGVEVQAMAEQVGNDNICKTEKTNMENSLDNGYNPFPDLVEGWIIPVTDEKNLMTNSRGECSIQALDGFPSNDFKIKRIEEWVSDLQQCGPIEEAYDESFESYDEVKKDTNISSGLTPGRVDGKVTAGMEAAKRYISSLNAAANTAQLSNHGLTVIPFLSAFVSLRVLNLSGNSIGKITAGALPRGLHMLNLSKNNIAVIEGLRELTRLRVLDLSYNRIFRIGHGLASCSSLKELYLAGNKISDVEGLHRLLKLSVLDLRFNKISTAKCLGQLAANYNSLQAISLQGNPAQKNVGDDQLKKYLQGLLPHLVYYNRQPTKSSTLKDAADHSFRLAISAHHPDHRGLRSDYKVTRKSGHGSTTQRSSSSTTHGNRNQAAALPTRLSKVRHGRLPPSGIKANWNTQHPYFDYSSKPQEFKLESSIRKSWSEGTLGAF